MKDRILIEYTTDDGYREHEYVDVEEFEATYPDSFLRFSGQDRMTSAQFTRSSGLTVRYTLIEACKHEATLVYDTAEFYGLRYMLHECDYCGKDDIWSLDRRVDFRGRLGDVTYYEPVISMVIPDDVEEVA